MKIFECFNGYVTEFGIILTHECSEHTDGWAVKLGEGYLEWFKDAAQARQYAEKFAIKHFELIRREVAK